MPNQRQKGKKCIALWIDKDLVTALNAEARALGISRSELVARLASAGAEAAAAARRAPAAVEPKKSPRRGKD